MKIRTWLVLSIAAIGIIVGWKIFVWGQRFKKETGLTAPTMVQLLFNGGAPLASSDGRTNVLILGISGGTHPGADLTDTMLVMSIRQKDHRVTLISIPRDMWSEVLQDKVNSAYHYGEEREKGAGIPLAKASIDDVVGLPVHYGFVIDFSGFKTIIDLVGGIDVFVPSAFTDPDFPVEGKENDVCGGDPQFRCRYEPLHFDRGLEHMDGTRALQYVRSRHAEDSEGSDFARSRRQQDVLVALQQKLLQPKLIFQPGLVAKLFRAFDEATDMDMTIGELLTVGKLLAKNKQENIKKIFFEDQLVTPPLWQYNGRYVLVPREDFDAIHEFIKEAMRDK